MLLELQAQGYSLAQVQNAALDRVKWRELVMALRPTGHDEDR
jgi:hypothetical protein